VTFQVKSILVACLLLISRVCLGLDFFPTEPGPEMEFPNGTMTIKVASNGEIIRSFYQPHQDYGHVTRTNEYYELDELGNILFRGETSSDDAWDELQGRYFYPRLKYLDYPLETGKTWSTTAIQIPEYGTNTHDVVMSAQVLGPESVTVAAGAFDVIAISMSYQYPSAAWMNRTEVLWFHRQLGLINGLTSFSGVVASDVSSWGSLKALYR
jgi:hypothetical protein